MKKLNYIYQFDCFQKLTHTGVKQDFARVDVYSNTEKDALGEVKKIITKKEYELATVLEYYPPASDRPRFNFTIQAYDIIDEESGSLQNSAVMRVWSNDPKEALKRAGTLIKRKFYRISSIIEKLTDES